MRCLHLRVRARVRGLPTAGPSGLPPVIVITSCGVLVFAVVVVSVVVARAGGLSWLLLLGCLPALPRALDKNDVAGGAVGEK